MSASIPQDPPPAAQAGTVPATVPAPSVIPAPARPAAPASPGRRPRRVLVHEFLSAGAVLPGLQGAALQDLRAQGRAMRDALARDFLALGDVEVHCVDSPAAPAPAGCIAWRVQAPDEPAPALLARLLARSAAEAVYSIAPESAGCLLAIARALPAPRWGGCTPAAIALTGSKTATRAALRAAGLPVPAEAPAPGAPAADEEAAALETAWVVKPDDGAGAADTHRHTHLAAARQAAQARRAAGEPVTLEAWVDGEALSLSLLCGAGGCELLAINRQHLTQHLAPTPDAPGRTALAFHGVTAAVVSPSSPRGLALAALARQVSQALPGLRGYVGIDLVWQAQRGPVLIEINPRLTSAYVGLSQRLGRPLAAELLQTLA